MEEDHSSLMTYRGHQIVHTLIRCRFSPAHTTGQRYIYTGCASGAVVSKYKIIFISNNFQFKQFIFNIVHAKIFTNFVSNKSEQLETGMAQNENSC